MVLTWGGGGGWNKLYTSDRKSATELLLLFLCC